MTTRVFVAEDETYARQHLELLLADLAPDMKVVGHAERSQDAVDWLRQNQADLLLLDIHLADDTSFAIFEKTNVTTPAIFTTAYDQYALQAFQANGIDYLLKPIDREALQQALLKYRRQQLAASPELLRDMFRQWAPTPVVTWRQRFLVQARQQMLSIPVEDIAYFEGEDRYVHLVLHTGQRYLADENLSVLENSLNPRDFKRVNRSFIISVKSLVSIQPIGKSRLQVQLKPQAKRDVYISASQSAAIKSWLNQ